MVPEIMSSQIQDLDYRTATELDTAVYNTNTDRQFLKLEMHSPILHVYIQIYIDVSNTTYRNLH